MEQVRRTSQESHQKIEIRKYRKRRDQSDRRQVHPPSRRQAGRSGDTGNTVGDRRGHVDLPSPLDKNPWTPNFAAD
jgi:hypothetical protein